MLFIDFFHILYVLDFHDNIQCLKCEKKIKRTFIYNLYIVNSIILHD